MGEYIERSGVLFLLEGTFCLNCKGNCKKCKIDKSIKILEEEPAADVAPVVHGRWRTIRNVSGFVACDKCGYWCGTKSKYCPDCGAKMDEEELHDC